MSAGSIFSAILRDVGIGVKLFMGIEPQVYPILPAGTQAPLSAVTDDLTQIGSAVTTAQAVITAVTTPGETPAQIVAAAAPLVSTVIQKSELALGKKVLDPALYAQAINEITQGVVDLLSSIEKAPNPPAAS